MFLKALEVSGFKSFPDKTRLDFKSGITAIVGPNGSGKSNISDALRWVMGEQSYKALRGAKMEDVIFGGTQKRGPKSYCEVTIILDNSDGTIADMGSEVELTRRYYRSGESEYKINRQNARLRDLNELLMDTGLGRDGYSIIGQGRIDEILSVKSTDRREIFEAAAGITRYRFRKEEAGRKLEKAGQDLLRAGDKISELELQVGPLKEQSDDAQKYLKLRDELRNLEISIWVDDLDKIAERESEYGDALKDVVLQKSKAESELEKLYAGGEELSEKCAQADMLAAHIREDISHAENEAAEIASKKAGLHTAIEAGRENIQRLKQEIDFQSDREGGILRQIEQRREHIKENESTIAIHEDTLKSVELDLASLGDKDTEHSAQLAIAASHESSNTEKLTQQRDKLTAYSAMVQELEDRDAALLKQINETDERLKLEETSSELDQAALLESEKTEKARENTLRGYTMRFETRRKRAEKAADDERSAAGELAALQSRIQMLRELERDYTGFSRAVKTIMQETSAGRLHGILGTVAENMTVPDKYTVAIETALGGAIGDIITEDENDAKSAVQLLKRRDSGRATFQPLTSVKGSELNERGLESARGYEGIASRLVRFDSKFTTIYEHLLGRTVIASDLDSAISIAKRYGYKFRIVTLDGQVTNAGGSITGGSLSKNSGILSRANELARLEESEKQLGEKVQDLAKLTASAKKELSAAEYDVSVAQDELARAKEETIALRAKVEQHRILLDALNDNRQTAQEESKNIRVRLNSCVENIHSARQEIKELEAKAEEIAASLEKISRMRTELSQKVSEATAGMADIRAKIAVLTAENEAAISSITELEELRAQMGDDRARQNDRIKELSDKEALLSEQLADTLESEKAVRARISELNRKAAEATDQKLLLEAERARKDKRIQDANSRLLAFERDLSELQRKLDSAHSEAEHITSKLWDNYELSRSMAAEMRKDIPEGRDAALKQTTVIRRKMSALGSPNIGAIDEYKRVKERYDFLSGQRDDIQKSIDELNGLISEISGSMEEIFSQEFTSIQSAFSETFADLFGGGNAELKMEDPENMLESGIEIFVQPPGKKLKNLSLLSGGEKAYVAIALYFAILKVHAAPFVVMDEIEAALDEDNVAHFASYMRGLTDNTQFLVITHRRGTMEEADMLYGVTMQEQGVSKVLSLDLQEAEKTIDK